MKNLLIDAVLAQMQKDFEAGDMTAIEELLRSAPYENLVGYLPEQTVNNINMGIQLADMTINDNAKFQEWLDSLPFKDDGNTRFFIDEDEVSCEEFNDYFDSHDTGWQEQVNQHGTLVLTIFTDDARS